MNFLKAQVRPQVPKGPGEKPPCQYPFSFLVNDLFLSQHLPH